MTDAELQVAFEELNHRDGEVRLAAARRLAEAGEAGAAVLARALAEYPWLEAWRERLMEMRNVSASVYEFGGGEAYQSLPQDFRRSTDFPPFMEEAPLHVLQAILRIGQSGLDAVISMLRSQRIELRLAGLLLIHYMDTESKDAGKLADVWSELFRDTEPGVRLNAYCQAARLHTQSMPLIRELVSCYHRAAERNERFVIVQSLVRMRCPRDCMAEVVAEFINEASVDEQKEIYGNCNLSKVSERAEPIVPQVVKYIHGCLPSDEYAQRSRGEAAASALLYFGRMGRRAVVELAEDPNQQIREITWDAIGRLLPLEDGDLFGKLLLDRLEPYYERGERRWWIERALEEFSARGQLLEAEGRRWEEMKAEFKRRTQGDEFVKGIIEDLQGNQDDQVWGAVKRAEEIPERAALLAPHLLRIMVENKKYHRASSASESYFQKHIQHCVTVAPELMKMIETGSASDITKGWVILSALGEGGAEFTPRLRKLLDDADPARQFAAMNVIKSIAQPALEYEPDLVAVLAARLEDKNNKISRVAAETLGVMGAEAVSAVGRLQAAAMANTVALAAVAREALVRISMARREKSAGSR